MSFDLKDYVDVAERIAEFREQYPEGSLQQVSVDFMEFGDSKWVVYTAAAYRHPDDPRPGHGTAWEPVPGKTPYTRDSELQNAETSAWGRAIVAVLAADTRRGVSSRQEVRNRRTDQQPDPRQQLRAAVKQLGLVDEFVAYLADQHDTNTLDDVDETAVNGLLAANLESLLEPYTPKDAPEEPEPSGRYAIFADSLATHGDIDILPDELAAWLQTTFGGKDSLDLLDDNEWASVRAKIRGRSGASEIAIKGRKALEDLKPDSMKDAEKAGVA